MDDRPTPAGSHPRHDFPAGPDRRHEIDRQNGLPRSLVIGECETARVVHQDVDPSKAAVGGVKEPGERKGVADVAYIRK